MTSFTRCITYNSYTSYTSRHNNNNIHHRQRAKKNDDILTSSEDDLSITDVSWEEQLRREATYALLPVFFPNSTSSNNPITAELSLKRLLRKRYQKQKHQNQPSNHDDDRRSNNSARGRLAALILGTSVMRLRHWYVVVMVNNNNYSYMLSNDRTNSSSSIPVPYPLDPSLLLPLVQNRTNKSMKGDDLICYNDSSLELLSKSDNHQIKEKQQLLLVRDMVDEHARYLLSSSDDSTLETLLLQSNDEIIDVSTKISIQYSLPSFLTSSLLKQYTYTQTKEICTLMNKPGPISIRRNAIQFNGSDTLLCKYLMEEDGVEAKALCNQELPSSSSSNNVHCYQNNNKLIMTANSDGSNRYVVVETVPDDDIPGGSIMPPEGAIRIIPPRPNATTAVEQRRSQRSSIFSMKAWQRGHFEVQDIGSQIIVQSMEAKRGQNILDYCAGNGGKTFAIASTLSSLSSSSSSDDVVDNYRNHDNNSRIVCHDVAEERLRQIKGSMSRVGFTQIVNDNDDTIYTTTSSSSQNNTCTIQITSDISSTFSESFDVVLVDAPCSSTGVLRRRPSQRWSLREDEISKVLPDLQLEILTKAASFVKKGGKLVYSTCSLLNEENESIVERFQDINPSFEPWEFESSSTNTCSILEKDGKEAANNLHTVTILPSVTSDGFFISRWKRKD